VTDLGRRTSETRLPHARRPWSPEPLSQPDATTDAVVLLPGIMGSVLEDADTGETLWGISGRALVTAWSSGGPLDKLIVTDEERHGETGRILAKSILTLPVAAPVLRGVEPYDRLRQAIGAVTWPGAVKDFPYDWRLSVEHNAAVLVDIARAHLNTWRRIVAGHPHMADRPRPRLVFVAHSMGGLIATVALKTNPALAADTRAVITLGTPFHGSVLAVAMLARQRRFPTSPRGRLHALAVSAPGLYDLLPIYRCVDAGTDVQLLTSKHISGLGGRDDLAHQALTARRALLTSATSPPGHRPAIGITQPTPASLSIDGGTVALQPYGYLSGPDGLLQRDPATGIPVRTVRHGDGTVYRDAAYPYSNASLAYVPARHGAMTRHKAALLHVTSVLTEHDYHLGPPAGTDAIGITVPDHVVSGQPWTLRIDTTRSPAALHASIALVDDEDHATTLRLNRTDGPERGRLLQAQHVATAPGLYRITVDSGSGPDNRLTELLIVTEGS